MFKFSAIILLSMIVMADLKRPMAKAVASQVSSTSLGSPVQGRQSQSDDIKRMRALVQQMESNLAFVETTQTPLKHQFQLEIDTWKALLDQMEKRDKTGH